MNGQLDLKTMRAGRVPPTFKIFSIFSCIHKVPNQKVSHVGCTEILYGPKTQPSLQSIIYQVGNRPKAKPETNQIPGGTRPTFSRANLQVYHSQNTVTRVSYPQVHRSNRISTTISQPMSLPNWTSAQDPLKRFLALPFSAHQFFLQKNMRSKFKHSFSNSYFCMLESTGLADI